jgi:hypothetical protein
MPTWELNFGKPFEWDVPRRDDFAFAS